MLVDYFQLSCYQMFDFPRKFRERFCFQMYCVQKYDFQRTFLETHGKSLRFEKQDAIRENLQKFCCLMFLDLRYRTFGIELHTQAGFRH